MRLAKSGVTFFLQNARAKHDDRIQIVPLFPMDEIEHRGKTKNRQHAEQIRDSHANRPVNQDAGRTARAGKANGNATT